MAKLKVHYDFNFLIQNQTFKKVFEKEVVSFISENGYYDFHSYSEKIDVDKVLKKKSDPKRFEVLKEAKQYDIVWYAIKHSCRLAVERRKLLIDLLKHYCGSDKNYTYKDDIFYDEDRLIVNRVDSLSEYITLIQTTTLNKKHCFFRGMSNLHYSIYPSLFRKKGYIINEDSIYKSALQKFPKEFMDCHTHFEKLVQMQHYRICTRLLDITTNPLVSLLFACLPSENSDIKDPYGRVILFQLPHAPKFPDSDTVSVLSAYGFLSEEDRKSLKEVDNGIKKDEFNNKRATRRLVHEIQTEKPFEQEVIRADLRRILPVYATMNNERIIKQSGLFLLAGVFVNNEELHGAITSLFLKDKCDGIPKEHLLYVKDKAKVLEELKQYSMTKADLFPNMDEASKDILKMYEE